MIPMLVLFQYDNNDHQATTSQQQAFWDPRSILGGPKCLNISLGNMYTAEFLIHFEAWAKLAQQWLVCAPLGIHLEPINKELMLLVTI